MWVLLRARCREILGNWWVKEEMWEVRMEMDGWVDGWKDGQVDEISHTFSKCLLRANCVPGTVLGSVNKTQTSLPP